jgi:uncharacterized membrane protein SirB2
VYPTVKLIHMTTVLISGGLFVLRGVWMMHNPQRLRMRWVRIVPHVNDTVLLGSAIALAVMLQQYPFVHGWLTAKTVALVVYIVLGSMAFREGRTQRARIGAWFAALWVFLYIVAVATSRRAWPL